MKNNLTFSIIMPYDERHHQFLYEAVQSVLKQTYPNWKLIIIAKDNQIPINYPNGFELKWYEILDSRINILYSDSNNQGVKRNVGIEVSDTDFIVFLDTDDLYLPERLGNVSKSIIFFQSFNDLKDISNLWFYGDCIYFHNDTGQEWYWKPRINFQRDDLLENDCGIAIGSVTLSTNLIKKYPFNSELKIGEDWEIWWRIMKETHPIYLPFPHYKKRVGTTLCRNSPMSYHRWKIRKHLQKLSKDEP